MYVASNTDEFNINYRKHHCCHCAHRCCHCDCCCDHPLTINRCSMCGCGSNTMKMFCNCQCHSLNYWINQPKTTAGTGLTFY